MDASGTYEIMKLSDRQTKDGRVITFRLHPQEDNSVLVHAVAGTQFRATFELVEE